MKKIVGIFAAAAVLATSVFAADVSAGVRLETNLFNFNAGSGDFSAITVKRVNQDYHKPVSFSISDDKAGAKLHFTYKDEHDTMDILGTAWNIWFKPADILTVNVGDWDNTLNQEQIGWWRTASKISADRGALTFTLKPIDGLSIDATFTGGYNNAWLKKEGDTTTIDEFGLMMHYGADFGTISAALDAKENFKNLWFGAGYSNTFNNVFMFVNALGYYKDTFNKVRVEAYAGINQDALAFKLFVPVNINLGDSVKAEVGAVARLDYALDACTVFVEIEDGNFLADSFSMSIKPGVKGKIGLCELETRFEVSIADSVSFSVPVEMGVSF